MNQPATKSTPTDNIKIFTFDPFMISNHNNCSKLYDITVTVMPAGRRKSSSSKVCEMELNLHETKPKLDSVTLVQYMEATLCILYEMATKDDASFPQALQFIWLPD